MGIGLWILIVLFILSPLLRVRSLVVMLKAKETLQGRTGTGLMNKDIINNVFTTIGSALLALIGINRIFEYALWDTTGDTGLWVLAIALVMFTIPAYVWEFMYKTGRLT